MMMKLVIFLISLGLLAGCQTEPVYEEVQTTQVTPIEVDEEVRLQAILEDYERNPNDYVVIEEREEVVEPEPIIIKPIQPQIVSKRKVYTINVEGVGSNFRTNSARLTAIGYKKIQRIGVLLSLHPEQWKNVSVYGHTDKRGEYFHNVELSKKRSRSVARVLVNEGVAREKVYLRGFGPNKPLSRGNNKLAWQQNRRVEIVIRGLKKDTALANKIAALIN